MSEKNDWNYSPKCFFLAKRTPQYFLLLLLRFDSFSLAHCRRSLTLFFLIFAPVVSPSLRFSSFDNFSRTPQIRYVYKFYLSDYKWNFIHMKIIFFRSVFGEYSQIVNTYCRHAMHRHWTDGSTEHLWLVRFWKHDTKWNSNICFAGRNRKIHFIIFEKYFLFYSLHRILYVQKKRKWNVLVQRPQHDNKKPYILYKLFFFSLELLCACVLFIPTD